MKMWLCAAMSELPANLDLNLLRPLEALLETSSVTKAAARLSLTQAATSNALQRLRATLGDPLLVRAGNAMQLTPRAEALRGLVRDAVEALARLMHPGSFDPAAAQGCIAIATSDHVDLLLLGQLERTLRRLAPDLSLHVEAFGPESFSRLEHGRLSLVIAPRHRMPPTLKGTALFEDRLVLVGRGKQPGLRGRLTVERLAQLPFLMVSPLGGVRGAIDEALEERGLQRRVVRSVPQFTVASLILKRADLVALLPETFARSSACRGLRVMQLPLELPPISMHAAWSPRYDADLRHQWLRGLLRPTVDAVLRALGMAR
jgi:DNA-binding transcriptional LysR family regulator